MQATVNATVNAARQAAQHIAEEVQSQDPLGMRARAEAAGEAAASVLNGAVASLANEDAKKKAARKEIFRKALTFTGAVVAVVATATTGVYLYKRLTAGETIGDIVPPAA